MGLLSRSIPVSTLVLLIVLTGCELPTAPQLLDRLDQATRELAAPGAAAHTFRQYVGYAARVVPPERIDSVLTVSMDGRVARYSAAVFERVVVRVDPADGFPCPLASRTLAAYDGRAYALLLRGSDFRQPMHGGQDGMWCLVGQIQQPAASPYMELIDSWRPVSSAISGTAMFDDGGLIGPCDFLGLRIEALPGGVGRIDCEIREYVVGASVRLGRSPVPRPGPSVSPPRQISFLSQRVVGIRITIYCEQVDPDPRNHLQPPVSGCEPAAWWRSDVAGSISLTDSVP